jgi:hypothetical protein
MGSHYCSYSKKQNGGVAQGEEAWLRKIDAAGKVKVGGFLTGGVRWARRIVGELQGFDPLDGGFLLDNEYTTFVSYPLPAGEKAMSVFPPPFPFPFRQRLALIAWIGLFLVWFAPSMSAAQPIETRAASRCGSTYVVRRGDTLTKIAVRCGVSLRTLRALNGRAVLNLRPGMVLRLSATPATPAAAVGASAAPPAHGEAEPTRTPPATPLPTWDQTVEPPER